MERNFLWQDILSHGIYYQDLLSPSLSVQLIVIHSIDLLNQSLDRSYIPLMM